VLQFANLAESGRCKHIPHWTVQWEQSTLTAAASSPCRYSNCPNRSMTCFIYTCHTTICSRPLRNATLLPLHLCLCANWRGFPPALRRPTGSGLPETKVCCSTPHSLRVDCKADSIYNAKHKLPSNSRNVTWAVVTVMLACITSAFSTGRCWAHPCWRHGLPGCLYFT